MEKPKFIEHILGRKDRPAEVELGQVAINTNQVTYYPGTDWMADGKCREIPPETFFPSNGLEIIRAQRICATCVVSNECLEYSLYNNVDHGVWGGKSERERRRIIKTRRKGDYSSQSS